MALERINPDELPADDPLLREHLERYEAAAWFLRAQDVVVDAACGVGYGTRLLAGNCRRAIGLDADQEAIGYAKTRYADEGCDFAVADLDADALPACDVLVSFETIEHLRDPERFIRVAQQQVRRLILLSAPLGPTRHFNPFHLHDFDRADIEGLLSPWIPAYFCFQAGASVEAIYGWWGFRRDDMEPGERMAWSARNLEHQREQFESQRRLLARECGELKHAVERQAVDLQEMKTWVGQVEEGKAWLEGQYNAWQAEAGRLQAEVDRLTRPWWLR